MKVYTFRATVEIDKTIRAWNEEEARAECLKTLEEFGFWDYVIQRDLTLIDVSDADK